MMFMFLAQLYLKLALIPTLIFAAMIGLIRAQPYDDSALRALLTPPEGCPAPCFMGIRPGVTTMEEALVILEESEWVAEIVYPNNHNPTDKINLITWYWNRESSQFILPDSGGNIITKVDHSVVDFIRINTSIPLAMIELLWGAPEEYWYEPRHGVKPHVPFIFNYSNYGISAAGWTSCPYLRQLWWVQVNLTIGNHPEMVALDDPIVNYPTFVSAIDELQNKFC